MAGLERSGTRDTGRPDTLARMRELDARKSAAAKAAKAAQEKHARERNRARVKRQYARAKDKQTGRTQDAKCESEQSLTSAEKDRLFSQLFDVPDATLPRENKIRSDLIKLSRDRKAPASARVTALRTVAEMDGHIGRLQSSSANTTDLPLASMTRAQLEDELRRLRAKIAPDATAK